MNDFSNMIREMLLAEDPYDKDRADQSLAASLAAFDLRRKTMRRMFLLVGLVVFIILAVSIGFIVTAPADVSSRTLFIWGAIAVMALLSMGTFKLWYFIAQNHLNLLQELRRMEERLSTSA